VSTEFGRLCAPSAEVQSESVAEQVAQISDVAAGKIDGDAFFRRNHFTEGLGRLVATGFERLAGKSESGAFYLTQAMGGGKTHSLITMALLASDPGLRARVVPEIAAKHPFGTAKVIAFDGHNSPQNFLWGNIADQLGRAEPMQRFWVNGAAAPGVDDWVATIGTDEPVLILLDELPSYLQMATGQAVGNSTLADQTIIALERLFNALPQLPKACVIVTNLKDDVYQDGAGKLKAAIDGLSKHYDRNATAITPVQQNTGEVFEIVRKRLFDELPDTVMIEAVGQAFVDALEAAKRVDTLPVVPETYLARIRETYPFHPSIRDIAARFSENKGYQKTRALIRLLRHAVRGALKSEEPVFLIGLQHLDLNDQATLEEVRKINASFTNAISRDIADRGNATAEKIDAADGKLQATAVSKLLLMSSLSTAENPTRGLREGELYEALVDPLVRVSDLKPALEKLQGQAWYLQRDTQERIYVSQTQNVTAEINEIASAIANEMVDETLRTKLAEVFRPVHGDVYDADITILPGGDELSVPDDRVRLIILEHKADELPPEFDAWWKSVERQNGVLLLTADPNAVGSMRQLARRMRAIDRVERNMRDRQGTTSQQLAELEGIRSKDANAFSSAVREAFKTIIYPVGGGRGGALRAYGDFRMEFASNDYRGEEQIRTTLTERGKYIPATEFDAKYELLRLDAEEMLFDADAVQRSSLKRKAALQPGWYWMRGSGLDDLIRMAIQRGHWRERDGLIYKRFERKADVSASIDPFAPDPIEVGQYLLAISTQDADTVYFSESGPPDPAVSAVMSGRAHTLSAPAIWLLAVDSTGKAQPSEVLEFRAPVRLRPQVTSTGAGMSLSVQVVPRNAAVHVSFDGSDPKHAPTMTAEMLAPANAEQARLIACCDGVWGDEVRVPLAPDGRVNGNPSDPPPAPLDDNKPVTWDGNYSSASSDKAFDALSALRDLPGLILEGGLFEIESKRLEGEMMSLRIKAPLSGATFDALAKQVVEASGFQTPAASLRLQKVRFASGRDYRIFADKLGLDFDRQQWKQP
jgi:hypothetical protein